MGAGGGGGFALGSELNPLGSGEPTQAGPSPTPTPSCLAVVGWIWKVVFLKKEKKDIREKKQSFVGE